MTTPDPSPTTPRQVGRYSVKRRIGDGGMSIVYEAHDPRLDKRVALKQLRPEFSRDDEKVAKFVAEARRIARLDDHEAILDVFECDEADGRPFITMRLFEGGTLGQLLRGGNALPADQVRSLASAVGGALEYAHAKGVVHCDVKPSNILINRVGKIVLADFGISRLVRDVLTGDEMPIEAYTPKYASPEQVRGDAPDARSDVFSLAVVLYQACCGRTPYGRVDSLKELSDQILFEVPQPPSHWNPSVPRAVDEVLLAALAKDPETRTSSAGQLAHDLIDALDSSGEGPAAPRTARSGTAAAVSPRPRRWPLYVAGLFLISATVFFAWAALDGEWPPSLSRLLARESGELDSDTSNAESPASTADVGSAGPAADSPIAREPVRPRVELPEPPSANEHTVRFLFDGSASQPEVATELERTIRRVSASVGARAEFGVLETSGLPEGWPGSASAEWLADEAATRGADWIVAVRLHATTDSVALGGLSRYQFRLDGFDLLVGGVDASAAPDRFEPTSSSKKALHSTVADAARAGLAALESPLTEWVEGVLLQRSQTPSRAFVVTVYDEDRDPKFAKQLRATLAELANTNVRLVSGLDPWRLIVPFDGAHHQLTARLVEALADAIPTVRFVGAEPNPEPDPTSDPDDDPEPAGAESRPAEVSASLEFGRNARQIVVRLRR